MYKVLIVDDEPLAREYLREIVDWKKLNTEICGEAGDGEEALTKTLLQRPDIILLDLNMPVIDGLSFAEHLKKNNIKARIVIITGNDEFECVRKSMQLDVKDYLLKPFDILELENIINRITSEIKKISKQVLRNKKFIVTNLLSNPITENIKNTKNFLKIDDVSYQIGNIYCTHESRRQRLIDHMDVYFKDITEIIFIKSGVLRISCICIQKQNSEMNLCSMLQAYLDKEQKAMPEILVGVSNVYNDFLKVEIANREATSLVNNGILFVEKGVKSYKELNKNQADYFYSSKDIEKLITLLRQGNQNKVVNQIENIFDNLIKEKIAFKQLKRISNGLVTVCYSNMIEKKIVFSNWLIGMKSLHIKIDI